MPKTAAISIKGKSENFSYAEALKKARTEISLEDMEISAPRIRKGMNGATIIEISGTDNYRKADELASKIQSILKEEAYVSRPKVKGEIKLIGLDEFIMSEEITRMVALEGDCCPEDVKVNSTRQTRSGLRIAWVKCPVEAAITISKKGKVKLGWTIVRAELLQAQPLQCFRCWRTGHVQEKCKSEISYKEHCFQCGKTGHLAKTCGNKPNCIICASLKLDCNHRVSSVKCKGVIYKEREINTYNDSSKENNMYKESKAKDVNMYIGNSNKESNIYKSTSQEDAQLAHRDGSPDKTSDNRDKMDLE